MKTASLYVSDSGRDLKNKEESHLSEHLGSFEPIELKEMIHFPFAVKVRHEKSGHSETG